MKLADRFQIPIVSFIDTPGAYPGIGAEQRGQASAIANSIECCMSLTVPNISIIIGEGGSGGAIALASSNKVIMLENSIYSVISPEGCASILWRDPSKSLQAAEAMKLTAKDLLKLKIIDEVIRIVLSPISMFIPCTISHSPFRLVYHTEMFKSHLAKLIIPITFTHH